MPEIQNTRGELRQRRNALVRHHKADAPAARSAAAAASPGLTTTATTGGPRRAWRHAHKGLLEHRLSQLGGVRGVSRTSGVRRVRIHDGLVEKVLERMTFDETRRIAF